MVRLPYRTGTSTVGFNMTPMIDVVFQLIIFFLVSSHMSRQDTDVRLPLPVARAGQSQPVSEGRLVVLHVQQDGSVAHSGQSVPLDRLSDFLREEVNRAGGKVELRLRCHRDAAYRHVKPLLVSAAQSGIWNVDFAVYASGEVE
ncbi:MAG: biopolymer transporter ExbD [Pirellulales bacterium]